MNPRADDVTPARPRPTETAPAADDDLSPIALLNVLIRRRRALLVVPPLVALFIVAISLALPRTYASSATFTTQSGEAPPSSLMGLAMQFGVRLPTGGPTQSPEFYADLLRGRQVLSTAVTSSYDVPVDPQAAGGERLQGDLVTLFEVAEESRAKAVEMAITALRSRTAVAIDPETGVVQLSAETRWPALSSRIVERLLELVNEFNLVTRQTQAAAERRFIEERLAAAEDELNAVESDLQSFLQANRRYENSPELLFQFERLQRRVSLRQQVFTSLAEAYEQARVEEVRNTPVLTVVDPPEIPALPEPRWIAVKALAGLLLGAMLVAVWAFGVEMMASTRERERDEYAELQRLRAEVVAELRGAWRRIRRPFGERRSA